MKLAQLSDPTLQRRLFRGIGAGLAAVLVLFLAANLVYRVALGLIQPPLKLKQLRAETSVLQDEVKTKERQKSQLQAKINWWSTPEGQLELAHIRGLVKPGEHSVVLLPPKSSATGTAPAALSRRPLPPAATAAALMLTTGLLAYGLLLFRRRRLLHQQEQAGVLRTRTELTRRHPGKA